MTDAFEELLKDNPSDAIKKRTLQLVGYFVMDTLNKIFKHIDRLKIKNTGTLRESLKGVMMANSGGNVILVKFWYAYYADMVEMAVGKYRGVDADLGKGRGVKAENIHAPQIEEQNYDRLKATFSGLPANKRREETHRPRPFFRSEIRRQFERISWRLMGELGRIMEMHVLQMADTTVADEEMLATLMSPFEGSSRKVRTYYPSGGKQW